MKSNTTAFRDGDRVRVSSQRGNDYTDRVPLIASGCTFGDADHEMVKQRYEPGPPMTLGDMREQGVPTLLGETRRGWLRSSASLTRTVIGPG